MKTSATAQLSTHQSAGDVIACVNGVAAACYGGSMERRDVLQTSPSATVFAELPLSRSHPRSRPAALPANNVLCVLCLNLSRSLLCVTCSKIIGDSHSI